MKDFACLRVMPSFEEIESLLTVSHEFARWIVGKKSKSLVDEDTGYCLTAGHKGKLRLWSVGKMSEVSCDGFPVEKSMLAPGRKIDAVHVDGRRFYLSQDDTIGCFCFCWFMCLSACLSSTWSQSYDF
jgi:hypothetical protein